MIFKYKGINADGQKVKDSIEALTLSDAKSKLKANNILYQSLEEDSPGIFDNINLSRKYKISAKELSTLSRELAMYIKSGITIVSAVKIVQGHYTQNKKLALFLKTVHTHLDEGKNFYSALDSQSVVILPEFFKQSIKVSENGGILDEVLLELSRFLKEQDRITKEVKGAFAYPAFMIVISLLMVAFMLTFVVPQITGIFENMNQELPTATKFVVALGKFFEDYFVLIIALIAAVVATHKTLTSINNAYKKAFHRLLLKMPLFGEILLKGELARFTYIGSLLVRSGVPFVQTIQLSANILDNEFIKEIFVDASQKVVEGKKLSSALIQSKKILGEPFLQAIALGEETSQVENVFVNISELYFEENKDKIALLLSLLEPALMLFVGSSIGFIVAAMLLPIFSMSIS